MSREHVGRDHTAAAGVGTAFGRSIFVSHGHSAPRVELQISQPYVSDAETALAVSVPQ